MTVSEIGADLLAEGDSPKIAKNRPMSPQCRPPESLAVAGMSPKSPESPTLGDKSESPNPLRDLYREWLDGIDEPRALVVLDRDQIRAAIAANAVAVDVVRTSVLLVYRSPLGAVGMLAIPLEKYDGFALMRAWEALQWEH